MRRRLLFLIAGVALAATAGRAQEGYPLSGTWRGDWGPSASQRTHITVVMSWDGKTVTGTINPGPDAIPIGGVFLDVNTWMVRIEADTKEAGKPVHITAEGKLDDIGSYHRTIIGTLVYGSTKADFKLTRE